MNPTIDKTVPLPVGPRLGPLTKWVKVAYQMEPGDSVLLDTDKARICLLRRLKAMGVGYTSRKLEEGGFRVWRLK